MASLTLTLAALATSAVPELQVSGVAALHDDPAYASALLETDRGTLEVRVPRSSAAEVRQSAEMLALAALSTGIRSGLGFSVPEVLGVTRAGETRAAVFTRLTGDLLDPYALSESAQLLSEAAEVIAVIHELPPSTVLRGGLPARDARECRIEVARFVERAERTRLLPQTVLKRWHRIMEDQDIWDFASTVVHGNLDADVIRVEGDRIVGIDGWRNFSVGDPAEDLAWLLGIDPEVFEGVIPRYSRLHTAASLPALRTRAQLYHELQFAEHLLAGVEQRDQARIDASVEDLDRLVDWLSRRPDDATPAQSAPVSQEQVESILASTPEVVDRLSDIAAQEALDEDRMFGMDTDFIEPLPDDQVEGANPHQPSSQMDDAERHLDTAQGVGAEQPTEPLAPEDLPTPRNEPETPQS